MNVYSRRLTILGATRSKVLRTNGKCSNLIAGIYDEIQQAMHVAAVVTAMTCVRRATRARLRVGNMSYNNVRSPVDRRVLYTQTTYVRLMTRDGVARVYICFFVFISARR